MSKDMRLQLILEAIDKSRPGLSSFEGNVKKSSGSVTRLIGTVSALGAVFGGLSLGAVAAEVFDTGMAWEGLNSAMLSAAGGTGAAKSELAFARAEAYRLGLDLETATEGLIKLEAASKGTVLQGQATRDIFSAISEASTVLNLSAADTAGAIRAIEQVMSKGTVQAEELRGQLGERIPGAFQIAARAMGVSTAELNKMLERGDVLSTDFLPKFAAELRRTYGDALPEATQKARSSVNRLKSAWTEFQKVMAESGAMDVAKGHIDVLTESIDRLRRAIKETDDEKLTRLMGELAHTEETLGAGKQAHWLVRWSYGLEGLQARAQALREEIAALKTKMGENSPVPSLSQGDDTGETEVQRREREKKEKEKNKRQKELIDKSVRAGRETPEDAWLLQSQDRQGVIEREYAYLEEKEKEHKAAVAASWKESTANWEQQLKDRDDVSTRHYAALTDTAKNATDVMTEFGVQAARNIQDSFANFLFDPFDDGLKGMLKNFGDTMRQMLSQIVANQALSGIFGGLAGSDNTFLAAIGTAFMGKKHSGGPIEREDAPRFVPRFHFGGLMTDEIPIVAQTGERMMSREQNKTFERLAEILNGASTGNRGSGNIIVNNYSSGQASVSEQRNSQGGVDLIVTIEKELSDRMQARGSRLSKTLESTYGLRRTGGR